MTKLNFLLNGTAGATATLANTGAAELTPGGTSTITFSSAMGKAGTGLAFQRAASQSCVGRWNFAAQNDQVQVTLELTTPASAHASGTLTLEAVLGSDANPIACRVVIGNTGNIAFLDKASVGGQIVTGASWGTRYRIALMLNRATGAVTARGYLSGSTTLIGSGYTSTGRDLGATAFRQLQIGDTGASAFTFGVDEIQMNDGAGSEIPEYVTTNTPPTVTAGADRTAAAGEVVSITAVATDAESAVTYSWVWASHPTPAYVGTATGLTGASTATVSATAPAEGTLSSLTVTATDAGGLVATDTVELRVPRTGAAVVVPLPIDRVGQSGTWGRVGSASTDGAALADSSDATFLESGTLTSTEQWFEVRAEPRGPLSSGKFQPVRLSLDPSAVGSATARIRLMQGATEIALFTQTVTTAIADFEPELTSGQAAAVTDPGNLRFRIGGLL